MIVGTAGHVDHGKTALVRALTGVDTDRLKEEKARGITIDLGFAYMPVAGGKSIGFVDVPGHERLVRTMVAGAAGIDFALLVVAADDGIMPQTLEHLDILRLLGIRRGLVAVTKCDRVDGSRRDAVAAEISAATVGTPLHDAELAFVSARSGEGIEALRGRLAAATAAMAAAPVEGAFRLPVDRAFSLVGVGTVATGTALAGRVRVGDEVVLLPAGRAARVRSLHAQSDAAEEGVAGQRLALALTGPGIGRDTIGRGSWICAAGEAAVTARFDADLHLLAGEPRPLREAMSIHCHVGAGDILGRVIPLAGSAPPPGTTATATVAAGTIAPGLTARVQIVLAAPVPLRHGDVFVLRDASAQRTIGGGRVIDPRAPARRRNAPERLLRLAALRRSDPGEALLAMLALPPGLQSLADFRSDRGLTEGEMESLRARLDLVSLDGSSDGFVATAEGWSALRERALAILTTFHADHPELPGLAGERLRALLGLAKGAFHAVTVRLVSDKRVAARGHWLHLPGHVAELSADDAALAAKIRPQLRAEQFRPPRVRDIGKALGVDEIKVRRACKALARTGDLVEVAHDHFFPRDTVAAMAIIAQRLSAAGTPFSAADFRDKLDNGRKVAIQILEFFDRHGLTRRRGDLRIVTKAPELVFGGEATPGSS